MTVGCSAASAPDLSSGGLAGPPPPAATSTAGRGALVMERSSIGPRGLRIGAHPRRSRGVHRSSPVVLARRKCRCEDREMDRRRVVALPAAGIVVLAVIEAARHPDLAPGGGSRVGLALQLAAGLALVAAAMHTARRGERAVAAALLAAVAGLALGVLPEPPH